MLVQLPDVEIVKDDNDDDHEDGDDDDANDQKSPQNLGLELANLLLGATVRLPDHWDDVHLDVHHKIVIIITLLIFIVTIMICSPSCESCA